MTRMNNNKKISLKPPILLFLVLALSMIALTPGCGKTGDETGKEETVVRVGVLKGPTAMSLIGLIDQPPVLKNDNKKYKVEFTIKANPKLLRAELLQQKIDIAVIPTTLASVLYNKGVPYKTSAVTIWGTLVLMGKYKEKNEEKKSVKVSDQVSASLWQKKNTVFDWNTLKNKEIHLMGKGMTPDILFRLLLEKKGLTINKDITVNYRFPQPQDLAQALAAGAVELAVISEPMASMVSARNPNVVVLADLTEEWQKETGGDIPLAQAVVIVKASFAKRRPRLVREFLNRYRTALENVNNNPQQAGELITKHGLSPNAKIAAAAIPRCHFRFEEAQEAKNKILSYLRVFYRFNPKIVGGRLPDEGFFLAK